MNKNFIFLRVLFFMFIVFIVVIISFYTYAFITPKIPIKSANQFYLYDSDENLIFQGSQSQKWVSLDNISPYLIDAVISTEDKNFYKHQGFDYLRIIKAMYLNIINNKIIQGASTISQQYIKNMYLDFGKTWERKIEEAFLTFELEVHYSKDEILEGYLNTINFGEGNYGIENASQYYFNKKALNLTLEEATILAGIPKSPNNYNPISNYKKSIERAKTVALAMVKNNKIKANQIDQLFLNKIEIFGKRETNNLQTLMYYNDAVMSELKNLNEIPSSLIKSGGLKIYTYLNMEVQTNLENAIINNMNNDKTEVASIVVDPKNGGVIALSGGRNYSISQFNRVTQAKRQVGSSIKPFLYYAALANGMISSSSFLSEPTSFVFADNETYAPTNYNDIYGYQNITMAAALAYSDNIYAVKTHLFLGQEKLIETARKLGLTGFLNSTPSLALGTSEINMLDYAQAYSTLANSGFKNKVSLIKKVEDMNGNILYKKKDKKELVLNENYTYILNEIMTSTYNSAFINYNSPTILYLNSKISRKYALKSGTTGNDYWVVGYNPDLLTIVWNGNDDNSKVDTSYSKINKNIWLETMENSLTADSWYEKPKNVVAVPLDAVTGKKSTSNNSTCLYYFVKGTEPNLD